MASTLSLGDRQKNYEFAYNYKIIRRVPVIIRIDGRSFSKVTRKLLGPYCPKMMELMSITMLETIKQMDGAVFGYQQSDEITFVLKNDQELGTEPWFDNRIQKMASITAATATYIFNETFASMEDPPNLIGQSIFDARVFAVPDYSEAVNNLIFRQQDCMKNALSSAAFSALGKKFGKKAAFKMLHGKNGDQRADLLQKECDIDFEMDYACAFRRGIGCYRAPHVVEEVTRHKWVLDLDLPKFTDDRGFVMGIITTGSDVFRPSRGI